MKSKHKLMKRIFESQGMQVNFDSFDESIEEDVGDSGYLYVDPDTGSRSWFKNREQYLQFKKREWEEENPELVAQRDKKERERLFWIEWKKEDREYEIRQAKDAADKLRAQEKDKNDREFANYMQDISRSKEANKREKENDAKWYNKLNPFYDNEEGTHDRLAKKRGSAVQGDEY